MPCSTYNWHIKLPYDNLSIVFFQLCDDAAAISEVRFHPQQHHHPFFRCPSSYSPPPPPLLGWKWRRYQKRQWSCVSSSIISAQKPSLSQLKQGAHLVYCRSDLRKTRGADEDLCTGTVVKRALSLHHCDSLVPRTYLAYNQSFFYFCYSCFSPFTLHLWKVFLYMAALS